MIPSLLHRLAVLSLPALLAFAAAPPPAKASASLKPVSGARWLQHFRQDLLPFWDLPAAWGEPRGNFPTFRCNDGGLTDPAAPCAELAEAPGWIKAELGRDYVRMKSRQTYFYGAAYHLTGDPRMLALARDGVEYLRGHALDPATGSAASFWEKGAAGPPVLQRTSQDLAYAQLGLAMYWYLTRDPAVLQDILRLKEHIFTRYWDAERGMLRWVVEDGGSGDAQRQELVAQLDQVNAYLLLLAPLLPEPQRGEWNRDLLRLARVMVEKYHEPSHHLFWGTLHDPRSRTLGSRHTDFGHTAKALWMLERIGRLEGERELLALARGEAAQVLKTAYLPGSRSWGSRLRPDGSVDRGKEWWIYAELDQLAATLALSDHTAAAYLPGTQGWWLAHLVDPVGHEVWGWADEAGEHAPGPKIHHWKSGYHSAEHALVGYLTAQSLAHRPATLYFAFADPEADGRPADARPYVYAGREVRRRTAPLPGFDGLRKVEVEFTNLR